MAEYIDRAALYAELDSKLDGRPMEDTVPWLTCMNIVRKFPAADVVEVVRCKDCKWCHAGYCEKYDDLIPFGCANKPWDDWFCADGEKENG